MNKYELKTAYSKIALSDEFKASAKEKLLACYDDNAVVDESEQELHTAKEVKLSPQPKKPWRAVVGVCAAAAVVGLGVWGVSAVIGRDIPIDVTSDVGSQRTDNTSTSVTIIDPDVQESIDSEKQARIERYEAEAPVTVFEGALRNGDSEYDFSAYIYQIMSETDDVYRGNCAIEITENGEVIDRNMLLVGYTLGQNGTEFKKSGGDDYFSLIELESGSVLLSTREDGALTQATLYTVKGGEIAQIERYFEDPADKPERDSSIRSFNLSRTYTTENDDIIFDIGGEEVRVTIDFEGLTLKCAEGYESVVYYGESSEDINTAEMKQYSLPMNGADFSATVEFSLPASWESSASTASYGYAKVFEIGAPWRASEDINTDIYKTDLAYGAEITVLEEKWGTDGDLYEYFIHTSTPIKYAPDGTYDVYKYVVESGGCYATVSVISDMGVSQETIDRVLKSVKITAEDSTEAENDEKDINFTGAYQVYEDKGEVFHIEETSNGNSVVSNEDIRNVQLRFALPYYWVYEPSSYFSGKAYFDGVEIFEYARPLHDDEPIDPDIFKTDFVDGDKVTVHEEKWGTDSDLFEYYIHRSTASEDADDGSFDEYIYIVNDNGYNITLTFTADVGLEQSTIDMILEMVQMECIDPLLYDKPLDINYTDTMLRYYDVKQVGESRFDEYELEWATYLRLEVELPMSWRHEMNAGSIDGVAYYNDKEIFSYDQPIKASEGIDTAALLARTTEGEEKYGADGDLFEYRLITPDKYIYVVNSGDYNITLTFDANAGLSQSAIDSVLRSVLMYEYDKCLDAIDGYFPVGDVWAFIHNGVEYRQDILTYRFVMDEYGNILEGDPENYNNINDYLTALKGSTYIGAAEKLYRSRDDVRYYLISDDVILGIVPCGEDLYPYVGAEELLSKYDADEIFHAYIYERIKG